jgi:hypothetical protein
MKPACEAPLRQALVPDLEGFRRKEGRAGWDCEILGEPVIAV